MLIVYTMGCAQSVQGMDAAEFMLVGSLGGRLHPSGYPIATYMMQLFQILPSSNIAFTTSFFSVFFGALALFVQSLSIQYLTQNKILSFILPLLLGCSPLWLRYCTIAEVFASAGFALSCLVFISILVYQKRDFWKCHWSLFRYLGGFCFCQPSLFCICLADDFLGFVERKCRIKRSIIYDCIWTLGCIGISHCYMLMVLGCGVTFKIYLD